MNVAPRPSPRSRRAPCRRAARRGAARSPARGRARRGGGSSRRRPGGSGRRRTAGTRGRCPAPVSRDDDLDVALDARQAHVDAAAARRELDRVREQVPDHLLQPVRVAGDRAGVRIELISSVMPFARPPGGPRRRAASITAPRSTGAVEPQLAGDDARHVEHVLDQLRLRAARCARSPRAPRGASASSRLRRAQQCAQPRIALSGVRSSCERWPGTRP